MIKNNKKKENKKSQVLTKIFKICLQKNNFVFHNDLVKKFSKEVGFGNPFDVTKIDNKNKLSKFLLEKDYCLIHIGSGQHKFVKGIEKLYHTFEKINKIQEWEYKKSILNNFNTSESNILSIANNQRILHHFLFNKDTELDDVDIFKRPKTYFPHRTKTKLDYNFGKEKVIAEKIQIEIDLTIEMNGIIGIFEAKNGKPDSFNVAQLYHPFLYYYNANKNDLSIQGRIKEIYCVYLVREKNKTGDIIKLWAYTFTNPKDITSIKLVKSHSYKLINTNK